MMSTLRPEFGTIDEYIASFPKDVQAVLEKMRRVIRESVRFPIHPPIPFDLVRRIVEFRVKENSAKK